MSEREEHQPMEDAGGSNAVDHSLERTLREVLVGRDPGAAPLGLRTRVDHVPAEHPVARRRAARRAAAWLATAAAVIVLVGIGATLLRPMEGTGGDGGAGAPALGADPLLQTGIGVADPPNQVLVVGLVVLLTLAAFYASAATSGRKSGVLAVLVVAIPALFLVTQALGPPAGIGGGTGLGVDASLGGRDGDRPEVIVVAEPGEPYQVAVMVANHGRIPVRLDGMAWQPMPGVRDAPSLWIDQEPHTAISRPATPFEPLTLAPGEELTLWLVQRASSCAVGAAYDPSTSPADGATSQSAIAIRWSVLGVPRLDSLELPYYVTTPLRAGCVAS